MFAPTLKVLEAVMQEHDTFGSALHLADSILKKIEFSTAIIGGMVVFLMMFAGVSEILLRSLFRSPIPGYIEAVQISIVAFAILPVSYCYQRDGHLKMDLVVRATSGRTNWIMKAICTLIALSFVIIILPGVYGFFQNSFLLGDSTMNMGWPIWPSKLAAMLGFLLLAFRLSIELAALLRMLVNPQLVPVGLPEIIDPIKDAVD
ncbi:MAG: TRAP transporter small permease [Bacteroidetes bacterium]|nr:TRAP transporter small permease [Bacteroidota bacterium]